MTAAPKSDEYLHIHSVLQSHSRGSIEYPSLIGFDENSNNFKATNLAGRNESNRIHQNLGYRRPGRLFCTTDRESKPVSIGVRKPMGDSIATRTIWRQN
jgi:hypothetical protein